MCVRDLGARSKPIPIEPFLVPTLNLESPVFRSPVLTDRSPTEIVTIFRILA